MLESAMTSADQALQIVLANVSRLGIERVPILHALGRVLAERIHSPRDIPGFDNSAMDGYAVRAADVALASESKPARLRVIETIPAGADAIVPVERTRDRDAEVEITAASAAGAFIRPRGEDLREGELAIAPGRRLTPADLGMLASLNRSMVEVYRRPRVAIVATGDELVDVDQVPHG